MAKKVSHQPVNPFHPGEVLFEEFLLSDNVTQTEFAERLGWTCARLNELINCKRGITSLLSVVFPARDLRLTLERNLQAGLGGVLLALGVDDEIITREQQAKRPRTSRCGALFHPRPAGPQGFSRA